MTSYEEWSPDRKTALLTGIGRAGSARQSQKSYRYKKHAALCIDIDFKRGDVACRRLKERNADIEFGHTDTGTEESSRHVMDVMLKEIGDQITRENKPRPP